MRQPYVEVRVFYYDLEKDGSYNRMGENIENRTIPFLNVANATAVYAALDAAFVKSLSKGIATESERVKPGPRSKPGRVIAVEHPRDYPVDAVDKTRTYEPDEEEEHGEDIIA